ncbi:MAG: hypothetical protein KF764_15125 [Labilithrix sp.]|nr:hypothetical protein [Labilithrix sp.]MBX3224955.1 hypothetical protein [Labilithrix sp.]
MSSAAAVTWDTSPDLSEDTRGAIMVTGLVMACFLIGSLWFIMGIGDTIVFRDKMQEAADHGAFSSAALHAKGMNFIALLNLVMVVGTVIHIILGIISDVKFAILLACLAKYCPLAGVGCLLCTPEAIKYAQAWNRWDNYFNKMKPAFKGMAKAQKIASYAYPALGVVESYQVGARYGNDRRTGPVTVVSLSTSLIPGGAIRRAGVSNHKKEGLPVEVKEFSGLCEKVVSIPANAVANLISSGKGLSGSSLGGKAFDIFNKIVGKLLKNRYCNKGNIDLGFAELPGFKFLAKISSIIPFNPLGPGVNTFWGEEGFREVYSAASNGSDWMKTWAINISPQLTDTSESKVENAKRKPSEATKYSRTTGGSAYFAESEFYFNCDNSWSSTECNRLGNAMFAIKWRARLRRLEMPALASTFTGAALAGMVNIKGYKDFKDALSGQGTVTNAVIGTVLGTIEGAVLGKIKEASTNLDPSLGSATYH